RGLVSVNSDGGREKPGRTLSPDVLETQVNQVRIGHLTFRTRTMSVLDRGGVHLVTDSESQWDEMGRLLTPEVVVACACGALGHRESFRQCDACQRYTCLKCRLMSVDGRIHCKAHDHLLSFFRIWFPGLR